MSNEEYVLAFEAILYGLIVSRILQKWNYMLQDDPPKRHYWAFWILTGTIFLLIIYIFLMNRHTNHYTKIVDPLTFLYYGVFIYIGINLIEFSGGLDPGTVLGLIVIFFASTVVLIKRFWLLETFTIVFLIAMLLGGYA